MPERKTHTAFDGSTTTMCGRPLSSSEVRDVEVITCKACCRVWDYTYGDDE